MSVFHFPGDQVPARIVLRPGAGPAVLAAGPDQGLVQAVGCLVVVRRLYTQLNLFAGLLVLDTDAVQDFFHGFPSFASSSCWSLIAIA